MALFLPGLQIATGVLLLVSVYLGFQTVPGPQSQSFVTHFLVGLSAAILSLFVHAMVMFYLIGSGKGMKEAIAEHGNPDDFDYKGRIRYFKMKLSGKQMLAILLTIAAGILGGGAGSMHGIWVEPWIHGWTAIIAVIANFWVFPYEYKFVKENGKLVHRLERRLTEQLLAKKKGAANGERGTDSSESVSASD